MKVQTANFKAENENGVQTAISLHTIYAARLHIQRPPTVWEGERG